MLKPDPENRRNIDNIINSFINQLGGASVQVYLYPIHEGFFQLSIRLGSTTFALNLPLPHKKELNVNSPNFFKIQKPPTGYVGMLTQYQLDQLLDAIKNNEGLKEKIRQAAAQEGIILEINDDFLNEIRELYRTLTEIRAKKSPFYFQNHGYNYRNGVT